MRLMAILPALDRIDRGILTHLAKNARRTNKELAAEVGLSQSACLERVRRLTDLKIIRANHADVDPAAFGIGHVLSFIFFFYVFATSPSSSSSTFLLRLRYVFATSSLGRRYVASFFFFFFFASSSLRLRYAFATFSLRLR